MLGIAFQDASGISYASVEPQETIDPPNNF